MNITEEQLFKVWKGGIVEWSLEEAQLIVDSYLAKKSMKEIGELVGRDQQSVRRVLAILEIPIRGRGKDPLTPETREEAAKCLKAGMTLRATCDICGIGMSSAYQIKRKVVNGTSI